MHWAWGLIVLAGVVWLTLVLMSQKSAHRKAWARLIAPGSIVLVGVSGLFGYGSALVQRVTHPFDYTVELNWRAPMNSDHRLSGYNVYRSPDGRNSFKRLNSTVVTETKYADDAARIGRTYDYYVTDIDARTGAESRPSNTIRVKVPWVPHLSDSETPVAYSHEFDMVIGLQGLILQ